MPRSSQKTVEESKMRMLELLSESSTRSHGGARLSVRRMSERLGLTEAQVMHARRQLEKDGLVRCEQRFAEDGGCLANVYVVTAEGKGRLAWEKAAR